MFLFTRGDATCLYTGDFRVCESVDSIPEVIKSTHINSLYIDTTFFCPNIHAFRNFPSRKESEDAAVMFVEKEREKSPNINIHIDVTPILGEKTFSYLYQSISNVTFNQQ